MDNNIINKPNKNTKLEPVIVEAIEKAEIEFKKQFCRTFSFKHCFLKIKLFFQFIYRSIFGCNIVCVDKRIFNKYDEKHKAIFDHLFAFMYVQKESIQIIEDKIPLINSLPRDVQAIIIRWFCFKKTSIVSMCKIVFFHKEVRKLKENYSELDIPKKVEIINSLDYVINEVENIIIKSSKNQKDKIKQLLVGNFEECSSEFLTSCLSEFSQIVKGSQESIAVESIDESVVKDKDFNKLYSKQDLCNLLIKDLSKNSESDFMEACKVELETKDNQTLLKKKILHKMIQKSKISKTELKTIYSWIESLIAKILFKEISVNKKELYFLDKIEWTKKIVPEIQKEALSQGLLIDGNSIIQFTEEVFNKIKH